MPRRAPSPRVHAGNRRAGALDRDLGGPNAAVLDRDIERRLDHYGGQDACLGRARDVARKVEQVPNIA